MFTDFLKEIRYMQYLAAIIATLPLASGVTLALWLSPSLPKLTSSASPIGVTISVEEASWLVSSSALGGACIALYRMFFGDLLFGRKTWLLIAGICLTIAWIVIYFSKYLILLCIARFIGGIGSSTAFITAPVYVSEIVESDIRGKLTMTGGVVSLIASVFIFTVGPFISYFNLALACCILPTVFLVLFYFMPESPYYQVKTKQKEDALNTLTLLSSHNSEKTLVNKRLEEIETSVLFGMRNKSNIWECISVKDHRRSIIIMLGAKTLLQLSGVNVIEVYAQSIIAKTKSSISPEFSSVLFGVIQIPVALFTSILVDKLGRKPLWILSALGCAVALIGEGLYFILNQPDSIRWLPTTCILLYLVMNPIGITTMPFVIAGEIFSTNIKSAAISLSTLYGSVLAFVVLKYSEIAAVRYGSYVVLWVYAGVCLLGAVFVFFVVPETKGKSLEEIQQMLNKNKKNDTSLENK